MLFPFAFYNTKFALPAKKNSKKRKFKIAKKKKEIVLLDVNCNM